MKIETISGKYGQEILGPLLLTPTVFEDKRGFFYESWNELDFQNSLISSGLSNTSAKNIHFCQDNFSHSAQGVLRGLHYQLPPEPQAKLVRCTAGAIFDVGVDLRKSSQTYGQWFGVELSSTNHHLLWLPVGFAHGFLAITLEADVQYKASGFWNRQCERALLWDDLIVDINWPLNELGICKPIIADKDLLALPLTKLEAAGEVFE